MKIKFLLLGTSLSFLPTLSHAQCVATQDCATLGYTETSCNGGKGVKCPFGNKWACLPTEAEICKKNGFTESCTGAGQSGSGKSCGGLYAECSCTSSYKYTCTGTGYAGGAGSACGGKYTQCTCSSGYEWKNGSCQQQILNGPDGDVYKCNGEIIAVKTTDMDFYVTMWDITPSMTWGSAMAACREKLFCDNLEGTLPTVEQLRTMYNNKSTLNDLLTSYGGRYISDYSCYWTSVSNGGGSGFRINMSDGTLDGYNGRVNCNVRPILTSW